MEHSEQPQEKQTEKKESDLNKESLAWEKRSPGVGILDLLQPILGSFALLVEEESKRTQEQLENAKNTLERMRNIR